MSASTFAEFFNHPDTLLLQAEEHKGEGKRRPDEPQPRAKRAVGVLSASKDSWLQWLLNKALVPVLLHPVGKTVMLALLVAGVVCGGIGITRLGEGLEDAWLAPDGHYSGAFADAASVFERNGGALSLLCVALQMPGCVSPWFEQLWSALVVKCAAFQQL